MVGTLADPPRDTTQDPVVSDSHPYDPFLPRTLATIAGAMATAAMIGHHRWLAVALCLVITGALCWIARP